MSGQSLSIPDPAKVLTLMYVDHCPNWPLAAARVREAVAATGAGRVRVEWRPVTDPRSTTSFAGSPTILVQGVDPFPRPPATTSLCCRFYDTGGRLERAPSVQQLRDALTAAVP